VETSLQKSPRAGTRHDAPASRTNIFNPSRVDPVNGHRTPASSVIRKASDAHPIAGRYYDCRRVPRRAEPQRLWALEEPSGQDDVQAFADGWRTRTDAGQRIVQSVMNTWRSCAACHGARHPENADCGGRPRTVCLTLHSTG